MNVRTGKKHTGPAVCVAGLFFLLLFSMNRNARETQSPGIGTVMAQSFSKQLGTRLMEVFVPVFSFVEEENLNHAQLLVSLPMDQIMPVYGFENRKAEEVSKVEDRMTIEMILLAEAWDEGGTYPEGQSGTDQTGNQDTADGAEAEGTGYNADPAADSDLNAPQTQEDLQALLAAENQVASGQIQEQTNGSAFVPHELQNAVDLDSLQDYETLVRNFYTIDKTTMAGSDQLNTNSLMEKDMTVSKEGEGPQILIYHTHSQEAFADSIPDDPSTSIVGVGEYLTQILTQQYGYQVLHHTGQYDIETRDDAYSRALPAIEQVLQENPGIQVVIDLHRDAMAEETHLVMDLDGRPTARFMFFNGLSRTRKTGNISYLYNENLEGNLAFSFQMQMKAVQYYPGLTRKIYLKGYRYNMHLRPRTLLIELGAQNNSVEEAMNACEPLAHILDMVLSGE